MFLVFPRFKLRISVFAVPAMLIMLWCEGLLPFSVIFLSALLHELGHIFAMKSLGHPPRRIDLLPMGALIVCPEGVPYKNDLLIALAGPAVSLACSMIAFGMFAVYPDVYLLFAALANLVLFAFNILPIEKLDGGKALRCFLHMTCDDELKAEKICRVASFSASILFLSAAFLSLLTANLNFGTAILFAVLFTQIFQK